MSDENNHWQSEKGTILVNMVVALSYHSRIVLNLDGQTYFSIIIHT